MGLLACAPVRAQLVLSEVCSRNHGTWSTVDGEFPDWVEVHNSGATDIQLADHFLSNDHAQPFQWRLPEQVLGAGAYTVLCAAGGSGALTGFPFKLPGEGSTLRLFRPDGSPVDALVIPALHTDHSFGRTPTGTNGIFRTPTPGAANGTPFATGYTTPPQFGTPPGRLAQPTAVTITGPAMASVHYTTDGTDPHEGSPVFTGPVPVDSSRVIKALSEAPGLWPSSIRTASYLLGLPSDLPVVSLAVHPDSMFHPVLGIYELGPNAAPDYPHFGANFWSDNDITADLQFFEPDAGLVVDQRVDLRIHGGTRSRNMPQRPLRLTARKAHGQATMDHAFFPDRPQLQRHKRLVLRNAGADFCLAQLRDPVFHQAALHHGLDVDALGYRACIVLINGRYWGLMGIRERIDKDHLHHKYGADSDELLLMEEENGPIEGDPAHFDQLQTFIRTQDMNDPAHYAHVDSLLDIASLKDYFALQIYAGNADWPANNLKYWKPSATEGKWRYLLYDLDATMNIYGWIPMDFDEFWEILIHRAGHIHSEVFRGLLGNAEFKRTFINRLADLLNTAFSTPSFQAEIDAMTARIEGEVPRHYARWGCALSEWDVHALGRVPAFAQERPGHVRGHVLNTFSLPHTVDLRFAAYPPSAGAIRINTIKPALPFEGVYFHGNAIDLSAEPSPGYVFDHWSSTSGPLEAFRSQHIRPDPSVAATITAHFRPEDERLFAYPSPTTDGVWLNLSGWAAGDVEVQVHDASGRQILAARTIAGDQAPWIDMRTLAEGLYTITVTGASQRLSTRVVRSRATTEQ